MPFVSLYTLCIVTEEPAQNILNH